MDTVERVNERVNEQDIRQAAIAMAWFAWNAAMRTDRIPAPVRSGDSRR